MPFDQFKVMFPPEKMGKFKNIHFSGHVGDPGMHPELDKIVEYVISTGVTVSINTNMSMRDPLFWWKLGMIAGDKLSVIADLDGVTQEMHSKYRRGTKLSRILENMDAIADTPAKLRTFTVVFKHNEDYVDDIKALAREHGATECSVISSSRFVDRKPFVFINEDGEEETLEQSTKLFAESDTRITRRKIDRKLAEEATSVNCSYKSGTIDIDQAGHVSPCCFFTTSYRNNWSNEKTDVLGTYHNIAEDLIATDRPVADALEHPFFDELDKSLDNPCSFCKIMCGKRE